MVNSRTHIPRYALFGEDSRTTSEEIAHCETIEARSRRYEWTIAPHRHPALYQLLLVRSGRVRIFLDDKWHDAPVPLLFVTPPGRVHGFVFDPDIDGHVLTLASRFVQDFAPDDPVCVLLQQAQIHPLGPETAPGLQALADQIVQTRAADASADLLRRALAEAFVRTAAMQVAHDHGGHDDAMVRRFQKLVETHGRDQRQLAWYANALACTERTLNRRVSETLGVAPMRYLHERLAARATRLLRFTNASCADVAGELGFADPSYFSRFYLRMTGSRPGAVRGSTGPEAASPTARPNT